VIGVPLLGRLLAIPVPDQPDQREVRHVMLRVVLLHRRPEHGGCREKLRRRQALTAKDQRQVIRQRARQQVPGRSVDGRAEIHARDLGAERRVERSDVDRGHGLLLAPAQRARPGLPGATW
jgi:hypothetical protein